MECEEPVVREFTPPRRASLAVTFVVAAAALAGCSTNTYEPFTADGPEQPDEGIVKGLMTGLGAIDPRDKPIDYKPRAALVVPPKKDLRAPENTDAALASRQFPTNAEDRNPGSPKGDTSGFMSLADQQKFSNLPVDRQARAVQDPTEAAKPLRPDQLSSPPAEQVAASKVSQSRKTLLDPPKDYATPNPNVPFEEAKKDDGKKSSWWPF
jgi:hypothetical protein